jgi:hypothetical protein
MRRGAGCEVKLEMRLPRAVVQSAVSNWREKVGRVAGDIGTISWNAGWRRPKRTIRDESLRFRACGVLIR